MISANLPALQVVLPLVSAPIVALSRRAGIAFALMLAASWATFAIAVALLVRVLSEGAISYHMGGWAPPWGIEYRIDELTAYVLVLITAVAAVCAPYARRSVAAEIPAEKTALFYAVYMLAFTGLLGIVATGDAFNIYVFLEISSLASYALISMGRDKRALMASFQYLILGTVGATFILIGVGLLYMMTGTLNIADLAARIPEVAETRVVIAAFAFLTVGLALKVALFPFHMWLPNAYTYAPSLVSAFLAATATKVGIYVMVRFVFTIFGAVYAFEVMPLAWVLIPFALVAMFVGSTVAIFQDDVKRLLAYSSVAQIGYIVLGIGIDSETGIAAGLIHLFNHGIMKGALFLALGAVALVQGGTLMKHMAGLGRRMPFTAGAIVIGGLSLVGVPLTVGFISKWYLVMAALDAGLWPVVALIMISSLLALVYVWRVVEQMYFRQAPEGAPPKGEAPLSMLIPTWVGAGACVYFGVDTDLTVGVARTAAQMLLGGA